MEIAFQTRKLRTICETRTLIIQEFDVSAGNRLQSRISDILSADNIDELPIKAIPCGNSCYRLSFAQNKEILFVANHVKNPTDSNGNINWSKIKRVKIVSIGGNKYDDQ